SVGRNFFGVFSANNTPDSANFPAATPTYQRSVNFTTHQLLNSAGGAVPVSIDPFFFEATELTTGNDFYVRDWTNSPTSGDNGAEPSTDPIFYNRSDVWNRRGTLPGT